MEAIIAIFAFSLFLIFLMVIYNTFFKACEALESRVRGENSTGDTPALLEKYSELKPEDLIPINAYFLDERCKKIPACIPVKPVHGLILGMSGSGKSTLVKGIAYSYLQQKGHNLIVIEPHQELCDDMAKIATHFGKKVTYIDLSLSNNLVVPWNPLKPENGMNPEDTASFLLGCFDDRFGVLGTPQQFEALKAGFILLSENDLTLDQFANIFYDNLFRNRLLSSSQSDFCKLYFQRYDSLTVAQQESKVQAAVNKISLILQDQATRLMLCQKNKSISLSEIINDQDNVLLVCLNRGANPTIADLLGSLFVSSIKNSIFRRKPNDKKMPVTHLFADEFPAYLQASTGSVLLAESRKYKIEITLISQFIQVSDPRFKKELLQNTGRQFLFNLEADEASYFGKKISCCEDGERELISLPPFHGFLIDKHFQESIGFVTKRTPGIKAKPVYSNARPVSEVEDELNPRKKALKNSQVQTSNTQAGVASSSAQNSPQPPSKGKNNGFQNFRNQFKRKP